MNKQALKDIAKQIGISVVLAVITPPAIAGAERLVQQVRQKLAKKKS